MDKQEIDAAIQEMFPDEVRENECELDALTTRLLEYELRHIMIKVWQEFPDDPANEEEKLVVEKFRNEAGDDIRNVIGLNVTKRLLNVHNKLLVKVHFSNRPEKTHLLAFLKKYNIREFKRVTAEKNTFAAQLKTIQDFDTICAKKLVICGNAKLTITPCYAFMKCPQKLITKFIVDADDESPEPKSEVSDKSQNADGKTVEAAKIVKPDEKHTNTNTEELVKNVPINTSDKDVSKKLTTKTENVNNQTAKENITTKPEETESAQVKTNNEQNNTVTVKTVKAINDSMKTRVINAEEKSQKTTENKQPVTKKTAPVTNNQEVNNKLITKEKSKIQAKNTQKVPTIKGQKKNVTQKQKTIVGKYDDYDEMDDEDILALLSEGVVLDECGSDDE